MANYSPLKTTMFSCIKAMHTASNAAWFLIYMFYILL